MNHFVLTRGTIIFKAVKILRILRMVSRLSQLKIDWTVFISPLAEFHYATESKLFKRLTVVFAGDLDIFSLK